MPQKPCGTRDLDHAVVTCYLGRFQAFKNHSGRRVLVVTVRTRTAVRAVALIRKSLEF